LLPGFHPGLLAFNPFGIGEAARFFCSPDFIQGYGH